MEKKRHQITLAQWAILICAAFVVVAVCTPVFAGGGPSIRTTCISHLKQVATGALIYTSDFDDLMPRADTWTDDSFPYIKTEDVFNCPLVGRYGYAMNLQVAEMRISKLSSKEQVDTVAFFDCRTIGRNVSAPPNQTPLPARHGDKNCFTFVDGHAKAL